MVTFITTPLTPVVGMPPLPSTLNANTPSRPDRTSTNPTAASAGIEIPERVDQHMNRLPNRPLSLV